jgi:two-component system phosphate regulon sensor histidine kinase PhoR
MRNVLHNLIDNALKYNDRKPLIEVDLVKKGSHVKITITDNGRGISKEHQQKIFDKFYRVSKGNLYSVKGTGIGLSYAKQVVELHNGKIDVRSVVNEGSTFTISLPCE